MNEIQFIDAFYWIDEYILDLYYYKNNILIMFSSSPWQDIDNHIFCLFFLAAL